MAWLAQLVFLVVLSVLLFFLIRRIRKIRRNILRGKDLHRSDQKKKRLRHMLLVAFGQKKMFSKPIPALLHLMIYVGFLIINLEVLEFMLDGLLGTHRVFAPYLGALYPVAMNGFELLALGVLLACLIFLIRRNVLRINRFHHPEMKGWPLLDANLILIIECVLMIAILKMNAADQVLQSRGVPGYVPTGHLIISSLFVPLYEQLSTAFLIAIERGAWWFHIIGILAFAVYVTYSKHLHIFLAFPNTYYANLDPKGKIRSMDSVTNEVKIMLGISPAQEASPPQEVGRFGAKDATDLTWKSLMEAYSCSECGRCTSECPANLTGKRLSPRKIMMDTRDRIEEIGRAKGKEKSLLGDYISQEEINACTSCNACTEACPMDIDPLAIILELKRYVVMEEAAVPASWNALFNNIETNFAPWKFAPTDRLNWAKALNEK